jgi:hypothetical protein
VTEKVRHVVVGLDEKGWCDRFIDALDQRAGAHPGLTYETADLEVHDWIEAVRPASHVVWNPHYMGPVSASIFKEKVFFLEQYLGKRVMPNYRSLWQFESKIAESYLLGYAGVPTPATLVTFDRDDAVASVSDLGLPVVVKESFGASSESVELLRTDRDVRARIDDQFHQELWESAKARSGSALRALPSVIFKRWFWRKVASASRGGERLGRFYAQEFVEGNDADLRVTVVGSRAVTFWRWNRKDDFRASGSGLLDYERPVPHEVVEYCIRLSAELGFDSMAYDILFTNDGFVIGEMSYNYVDTFVHGAPGSWVGSPTGDVEYVEGHVWPEEMWIDRLLDELEAAPAE